MEGALSFYHIICAITSFLGISLGFFLVFIKSKKNHANKYLGLLIWCFSLYFIPGLFEAMGWLEEFPHFIRLNIFSGVLVGPLTYLYCKSTTHHLPLPKKEVSLHFIPFLLFFIYYFPNLLLSKEEKLAIYEQMTYNGKGPDPEVMILAMLVFNLVYTIISLRIVLAYINHLKDKSSTIDFSFHRWLFFVCCTLLYPKIIVAIFTFSASTQLSINAGLLSMSILVFIIYFTLMLRPKFFHEYPHPFENSESDIEEKTKYQNSTLKEHQKDMYQVKLLEYMSQEKPYLDSELTIADFSEQLNIPSYYLSQIINERLDCNFLDFVNQYRIREAKKKLKDETLSQMTIMSLAFDSGFNSKTAFYSAFKKNVGLTPSQFRKQADAVLN